jgi:deoxycytidylate deaminase
MREKHFALAQKISRLSSHHSHKLGAVIAKRNKVVSVGYNQIKTHPVSTHPYQQLHA